MDSGALLFVLILVALMALNIYCAVRSYQRGHKLLFLLGIFLPPAWWLGAVLPPPKEGSWI